MRPSQRLIKPYFWCRPTQILRRAAVGRVHGASVQVRTPWRGSIEVDPRERVGSGIARTGIYDLAVSEVLWRLLDPAELAVDVGANIGFMSGLLAARTGRAGNVIAIEPNPAILPRLRRNALTVGGPDSAPIEIMELAASDRAGIARLSAEDDFAQNQGTASLEHGAGTRAWDVVTARLDEIIGDRAIGVMKLDVEGHEPAVLRGAERTLVMTRDLVYEDLGGNSAEMSDTLRSRGFRLIELDIGFLRPNIRRGVGTARNSYDARSVLATRAPDRALQRLRRYGWAVLNPRLFSFSARSE